MRPIFTTSGTEFLMSGNAFGENGEKPSAWQYAEVKPFRKNAGLVSIKIVQDAGLFTEQLPYGYCCRG